MNYRKGFIETLILVLGTILFIAYGFYVYEHQQTKRPGIIAPTTQETYTNAQYNFSFSLPASWRGYSIVTDTWSGLTQDGIVTEKGPMISIRHPQWTAQNPRQDIPILILTTLQWNSLQQDQFHIGAAPIGPSELGRNATYVFALPARYNYASPIGYEEVNKILTNKPLSAF